ncbi:DNA mismatch repair endonuclease MutL [Salinicoccus sp. ID82-1]|uniref:DNA mismatch repair endonuclease MutL n=1 Tax=Salinicoccus sp. ID82-1 TaxID=2820269 RepID=UPI001F00F4AD|nr:DNA mismatch repair endonuclease MutL [Salinicoccus sp. ID82-1]MCG1008763.1 DNA mismatch repair endonuclease MutL [Salinicoccus sp. ID82-1]
MGSIKVLDSAIQNKIAAGEVVERPSSVVKELLENSIDANARQIEVFIEESGMKQIRIVDDGDGIHHTDGPLLFQRHATSKIDMDYDLFQIRSLGFRGEALASIGAVAKVTVETKHVDGNPVFIRFEGGSLAEQIPGKERKGTDITITDLFYNTPARLKYMRSMRTESGKIIDVIQRMALAYPNISFRLVLDHSEKVMTKGNGNLKEVISDIYGLNIARHAVAFEARDADFHIRGFLIRPEITRSSRNYLNISVNRRFIRSFRLSQAVINGYHTLQPKDKYPIAIIDITMDPKLVDVNVHPAKTEVRFSKERELNQLLESAVRSRMKDEMLIPDVTRKAPVARQQTTQDTLDFSNVERQPDKRTETGRHHPVTRNFSKTSTDYRIVPKKTVLNETQEAIGPPAERHVQKPAREAPPAESQTAPDTPIEAAEEAVEKEKLPYLEIVGQLHGTYIILQNDTGMYMMDQHAAQERIKYEYYSENITRGKTDRVPLLIPYTFEFPMSDIIEIDDRQKRLQSLGFDIEKTGIRQYAVTAYPNWIDDRNPEADIEELIHFVSSKSDFSVSQYKEEMAIMMSCKQSIKANHYLDRPQIEALLESLGSCRSPYTCPHGRPVIIHMSTYEIERMFNRVMK